MQRPVFSVFGGRPHIRNKEEKGFLWKKNGRLGGATFEDHISGCIHLEELLLMGVKSKPKANILTLKIGFENRTDQANGPFFMSITYCKRKRNI
jgi:hypothetical protein